MSDETSLDNGNARERALARLHKHRDFQGHLVAYIVVKVQREIERLRSGRGA